MTSRGWFLLFLTALTACGLEFIGPESPAQVIASVRLFQGDSVTVSISARLEPGFGLDDRPRTVAVDTIQIMGFSLGPWTMNHEGTRLYETEAVVNPDSLGEPSVALPPPTIQGLTPPDTPSLNLTTRTDPFNLGVSNGADIPLNVVPPNPDSTDRIRWRLSVLVAEGPTPGVVLTLDGNGPPPAQVTVPGSVSANPAIAALEILLTVSSVAQRRNGTNDYMVTLEAQSIISWAVTLSLP